MHDALTPAGAVDGSRVLSSWAWLLEDKFVLWALNSVGDIFVLDAEGHVSLLDTFEGALRPLAPSVEAFERALSDPGNAARWLMTDYVALLRRRGVSLKKGQVYGWKVLPILGEIGRASCRERV